MPAEASKSDRPLWPSLLAALLFFANPVVLSLANGWERVVSDPLDAALFLQLEGAYAVVSFATPGRRLAWAWLCPVLLAAAIMAAQITFVHYRRLAQGAP